MVDPLMRVAKKMYKGSGAKGGKFHRPEGAGNFDNMDDHNIVASTALRQGTIQHTPANEKDLVNKEYVDDKNVESFPTTFTAGSVIFSDGTNLVEDNFNLFWDNATHELQPHHMKIVSDGSQASPALKFNDTNTGFYKSGDSVRFSLNNSTKMTIDGTGVGIGTTSPNKLLDVRGDAVFDGSGKISLNPNDGSIEIFRSGGSAFIDFKDIDADDFDFRIQQLGASGLQFQTGAGIRMIIDDDGEVGINITPTAKLHVQAPANDGSIIKFGGNANAVEPDPVNRFGGSIAFNHSAGQSEVDLWNNYYPATTAFRFIQQTAATTFTNIMTLKSNGKVGIGTTTPDSILDLEDANDGGNIDLRVTNTAAGGSTDEFTRVRFAHTTGGNFGGAIGSWREGDYSDAANSDSSLRLYAALNNGLSSPLVLTSGGSVGIGTETPSGQFEISATSINSYLRDTDGALNEKLMLLFFNAGQLSWATRTDANGAGETFFEVNRTGTAVDDVVFPNGNVEIKNDLFFTTDGSGLPYASCYGNDIAWTQAAAINVVYNVSDADMVTGQLNLATHDGNGKLTVTKAGRYHVHYTATIKSSIAGKHIISGFEISGSGNMEPAGRNHIDLVGANNQLECSGNAILDLATNATIEMAISSSDAGNPTVTVEHLNITCFQIGGT